MLQTDNLSSLSSDELERVTAAIFTVKGYFVERNRKWNVDKVDGGNKDICEIDLVVRYLTPNSEEITLVECKGKGTFEDIFKFSGVFTYVKPHHAILICSNPDDYELMVEAASVNNVIVKSTEDFFKENINSEEDLKLLNKWVEIYKVQDELIEKNKLQKYFSGGFNQNQNSAYRDIRKLYTKLSGRIWRISDPREQAISIVELNMEYKDFIRDIARKQGIHTSGEQAMNENILCQSAASLVVIIRMLYLLSAVKCAIMKTQNKSTYYTEIEFNDEEFFSGITDPSFVITVNLLEDNIDIACEITQFINSFVYLFGGKIDHFTSDPSELTYLAETMGVTERTIRTYFEISMKLFSIGISEEYVKYWTITDYQGKYQFLKTPPVFRGIGMRNKLDAGINIDDIYPDSKQNIYILERFEEYK